MTTPTSFGRPQDVLNSLEVYPKHSSNGRKLPGQISPLLFVVKVTLMQLNFSQNYVVQQP